MTEIKHSEDKAEVESSVKNPKMFRIVPKKDQNRTEERDKRKEETKVESKVPIEGRNVKFREMHKMMMNVIEMKQKENSKLKREPIMSLNERYQAICDAVAKGGEELINLLIIQELRADPLNSVFYMSVEEGHLPVLKAFADHSYGRYHIKFEGHNPVLETAVRKQHAHIVEYLLKQGANPNFITLSYLQDRKLHTLLHMAVHIGNLQIVKLLLDNGADVNSKTEKNSKCLGINTEGHPRIILNRTLTVLEVAIYKGNREIFDIILENGAFVEIESENVFPLHFAVQVRNKYAIEKLLDRGASINSVSRELENPLSYAVAFGQSEMVFDLMKRGATFIPNRINSVLCRFLRNCYQTEEIFDLLLNSGAILRPVTGITAFTLKICNEFSHSLEWRLFPDYGFDINSKGFYGNTPLHLAVRYKDKLALEMLIEYEADFSILNTNRETPLANASRLIDLHETERVITNIHHNLRNYISKDRIKLEEDVLRVMDGPMLNGDFSETTYGKIYFAFYESNESLLIELVSQYIAIEEKSLESMLHIAIQRKDLAIFKLLLQYGVDVNKLYSSQTPLEYATALGLLDFIDPLLVYDTNAVNTAMIVAIENENLQIIQHLLNRGADLNFTSKIYVNRRLYDGYTPLHRAVNVGNIEIVDLLLKNGADVNFKVKQEVKRELSVIKNSQIEYHSDDCYGHYENVHYAFRRNLTVLELAIQRNFLRSEKILDLLLKKGAAVDIESDQVFPLHLAVIKNSKMFVFDKLVQNGANVNSVCELDYTPLEHALVTNRINIAMYFLKKGGSFNQNKRSTPFFIILFPVLIGGKIVSHLLWNRALILTQKIKVDKRHCTSKFCITLFLIQKNFNFFQTMVRM
ncbi:putative ankyrin repeat protein RF_0381 [Belonocnema kinseyi]|uniref:putative ankyrin repeat protein RF_0381 n=1 Tax=Belonocnema kinseyi TaxID=2817044 RepID=UPI00143DACF7|nr:putative ankyrin repeat protein RF_0381 [Belonocnema kinseyi]